MGPAARVSHALTGQIDSYCRMELTVLSTRRDCASHDPRLLACEVPVALPPHGDNLNQGCE
ncbi:hypothetical protein AURDEDRAFT_160888 [Auricularia subglabra TFB-10046 SS5]|nr:hypothetical protein AURDEDRAFT_160888 [Auricularia subglabra TFB-10046 SS5]